MTAMARRYNFAVVVWCVFGYVGSMLVLKMHGCLCDAHLIVLLYIIRVYVECALCHADGLPHCL